MPLYDLVIEDGEKNSSHFFNLEKQRHTKKKISKLNMDGIIVEDSTKLIKELFYSKYLTYYT